MERTRRRPSSVGCCGTHASICTSPRLLVLGLTWSNAGSRSLLKGNCAGAFTAAPANSKTRFELSSTITTEIRNRSSGPKLPIKSSNRLPDFVNEFPTQDTSSAHLLHPRREIIAHLMIVVISEPIRQLCDYYDGRRQAIYRTHRFPGARTIPIV